MPQITVTLNVTNEQLLAFIAANASTKLVDFKAGTDNRALKTSAGIGMGSTPKLVTHVNNYRRAPGDTEGRAGTGRPSVLNVRGMKAIWDFYNQGYSLTEIARAFKGVIGVEGVRKLIRKIEASTKEC